MSHSGTLVSLRNLLYFECIRRGYVIGDPPRPNVKELHRRILKSGANIHQTSLSRIFRLDRPENGEEYNPSAGLKKALCQWLSVDEIELMTMWNNAPEAPLPPDYKG